MAVRLALDCAVGQGQSMRVTLISPENKAWQNALGVLAAVVLVPIAIVAVIVTKPFQRPIERTPEEVACYLSDFIEGTGGEWDFDDFVSIPIADPQLESIRDRAGPLCGPMTDEGLVALRALLEEAEALTVERRQA